ncbi:MAG: M23 family metallopeptidase [candidate division Zixibacteria bacterium]|nr:M23 family metallopeptidase [candidate division Zixibacteria bacterium]
MFKKRLTFIFIPDSNGISRQVSVSAAVLYISIIFFGLVLSAALYFSSAYVNTRVDQAELATLQAENNHLSAKFGEIQEKLSEVDTRFQELVQKEIALRSLFQLPEIDVEERFLGVGGPDDLEKTIISEAAIGAYGSESVVDRLLRLSSFELERFSEVETKMQDLKSSLDRTPCINPTRGWFSRGYGMKFDPFTGTRQMHRGVDIAGTIGTYVHAPAGGHIVEVGRVSDLGIFVVIDHGDGLSTRYGHLSASKVKYGQLVHRGDLIGLMGSTGRSTGSHLHYEVWKDGHTVNPADYILDRP